MTKRAGMSWRLLAHDPKGQGGEVDLYSQDADRAYRRWHKKHGGTQTPLQHQVVPHPAQFDELVVDQWIHIEQMDNRVWWMRVGDYVLWVTVAPDGTAKDVTVEKDG